MNLNTIDIVNWLRYPSTLKNEDLDILQYYEKEFPQISLFSFFIARILANQGSLQFENQLRKASLNCSNRNVLYKIMHSKVNAPIVEELVQNNEHIEHINNKIEEENTSIVIEEQLEKSLDETIREKELPLFQNSSDPIDVLIRESLIENVLRQKNQEVYKTDEEVVVTSNQIDQLIKEPQTFGDWLNVLPSITHKKSNLKSANDLIEAFLIKNPGKIVANKNQEFDNMYLPEKETDNHDFVTETLATIYAKQGKNKEAIEIYRKLILIIPDKKTYFASRIRFLEEKLKIE